MLNTPMRFAIYARVSSAGQEKDGYSLDDQVIRLTDYVHQLKGIVEKTYIAQESATYGKNKERPTLESMLRDAKNGIFDAVIVYDLSRLTRNIGDVNTIPDILVESGVRLFEKDKELDLEDSAVLLMFGISTLFNSNAAKTLSKRAIEIRIENAYNGWPVGRHTPYGRRVVNQNANRRTENAIWEVIPEYQEKVLKMYDLYVNTNYDFDKVANAVELSHFTVRDILTRQAGSEWVRPFSKGTRKEMVITTKIPPILTDEQINRVKQKSEQNRKNNSKKSFYLLSSYVKCGLCSYSFSGMTNKKSKIKYYNHSIHSKGYWNETHCCPKTVRADKLESAVFFALGEMLSSIDHLSEAIERIKYNSGISLDEENIKVKEANEYLKNLDKQKDLLVDAVGKGDLRSEDVRDRITKIREDKIMTLTKIKESEDKIKSFYKVPENIVKNIRRIYEQLTMANGKNMDDWIDEKKARLMKWLFFGNKKNAIYVKKSNDEKFEIEIIGNLGGLIVGAFDQHYTNAEVFEREIINDNFINQSLTNDFSSIISFFQLAEADLNMMLDQSSPIKSYRVISR